MLLEVTSYSQFRIGICIAIIILLLGIVSIYTIKTLDDINENFNLQEEYYQKITNLNNISEKYEKQAQIFEGLESGTNHENVGNFWIYSTEIKNEIQNLGNYFGNNIQTNELISKEKSRELQDKVRSHYELHLIYENSESDTLDYFYEKKQVNFLSEYDNLKYLQSELANKIDDIKQTLEIIPISSKISTGYILSNFQTLQWTMIILIGIITTLLVFFLNQTNTNLKLEIKSKTQDLEKLNEELKKVDMKRGEFIAIASHELKGPIQPIFGFLELAKTGIIPKQEALDGISNIAANLENIANNVLDLTKIQNDELELHLEKVNINEIIQDVVNSEQHNPDRKVPIKTRLDVDIIMNLDKTRIRQVFRNIVSNCIKFTESGEITIQSNLLKDEKVLKLFFSDTGPEIPKEILHNIFNKFVTEGMNKSTGFGLGLYISKKIIDAHNGNILAYNDKGYPVFEITLPIMILNHKKKKSNQIEFEKIIK